MDKNVRISSIQLIFLIVGFTFGQAAILNASISAQQDAWLVNIISLFGGLMLISIYSYISMLNPGETLIGILKNIFGKYIGNIIAVLYLWYFIHIGALVLRSFMEFMVTTIYPQTPMIYIAISLLIVSVYAVKSGLEVIARISELLVPILFFSIIFLLFALLSIYDVNNFLPVLERGFKPVLKASFHMVTFPYGETICLLMLFPHLNKDKKILNISLISITIVGFVLLSITVRDLMVLGPDMIMRSTYPNYLSIKLVPGIDIEALIATNLLIGGGIKISICLYAASMSITQIFKLDNYKSFVIPVSVVVIALSVWLFESLMEKIFWDKEVYPYYAIPFQVIIPLFILCLSLLKKYRHKQSSEFE